MFSGYPLAYAAERFGRYADERGYDLHRNTVQYVAVFCEQIQIALLGCCGVGCQQPFVCGDEQLFANAAGEMLCCGAAFDEVVQLLTGYGVDYAALQRLYVDRRGLALQERRVVGREIVLEPESYGVHGAVGIGAYVMHAAGDYVPQQHRPVARAAEKLALSVLSPIATFKTEGLQRA